MEISDYSLLNRVFYRWINRTRTHSDSEKDIKTQQMKSLTSYFVSGLFVLFLNGFTVLAATGNDNGLVVKEKDSKTNTKAKKSAHSRKNTYMKRRWGVEILHVRHSAAGYMLEFRYKVHDAEKSKILFKRKIKPILTHIESGAKLIVPTPAKTGALRNSNLPLVGRTYWMFFANPAKLVKQGDHVNIQIGDFLVENLNVE